MPDVTCSRCGQTRAGFERPPIGVAGAAGERLVKEVCQQCWADWLKQQTMLINHYGLNLMDPQARSFLSKNRDAFLYKAGASESVDTTRQGTIAW
jgi:Fe-S cluster biosynthesis and repair protein YggX